MIDRATVDKILDAAQIVDVVSDFVTLRKAGVNYKGLCPFHDDRTPSFVVSPSKGLCKCFACGKGGNAVHFIMEHENLSYPDALRYLAKKYHIEIKERELTDQERKEQGERESMFVVNEWANRYFQDMLWQSVDGQAIGLAYFRSRGFRDDIIKKFQLGFCSPERDACTRAALAKGFKQEYLLSTGLTVRRDAGGYIDRFRGRVIFPVHTLSGKVVAFGGRVLDAATKGVNVKYQNSPESAIYSKKRELYGLYLAKQAIVRRDLCFLVEGYTDVISMHQMGVENVVSSSGTALTTDQIRLIHRFTDNITVLYDGDAAGIKASERGIDMLLAEGMNVKLLLLPDGDDPDSFARKHNMTDYQAYLNEHQTDFIRFKTGLLIDEAKGDPIKLSRLINSIVHSISVIPDEITRSVYTRETAAMLAMEERTLVAAIAKERRRAKEEQAKQREQERRRAELQQSSEGGTAIRSIPGEMTPETPGPGYPDAAAVQATAGTDTPPACTTAPPANAPLQPAAEANPLLSSRNADNHLLYTKEVLLMQVVMRYGEKVVCHAEDEQGGEVPVTVAEYVHYALQDDGLVFRTPLHERVLSEALEHIHEEGFPAQRYFLNHPDAAISTLAFELCGEKYQLSKYHSRGQKILTDEERLPELVPHLLCDFKLSVVEHMLKQILNELRNPAILADKAAYMDIMKRYKELKESQCRLAAELGDRVLS